MKNIIAVLFVLAGTLSCSSICRRGPGNPDPIAAGDLAFEINELEPCCIAISPLIYGTNSWQYNGPYPGYYPLRRLGGEGWSAYNWEKNTKHDEGANKNVDTPRDPNPGASIVTRVNAHVSGGARAIITVPMLDCVAADGVAPAPAPDENCGQASTGLPGARFKRSVARKGAALVDPPDRPEPDDSHVYQDEFINWMKYRFTESVVNAADGSFFFALDNEPDIWHGPPHAALHATPPTYQELIDRDTLYAHMIKDQTPNALVFGPVLSGWTGIWYWGGGEPFVEHYLKTMKQVETVSGIGRRLIDVLDIHWYPEGRLYVDKDNDGIQDRTKDLNGDGVITAGEDLDGDGDLATEPNYFCDLNGNGERNGPADLDGDGVFEVKNEPEYRIHEDPSNIPTDCPDPATRLTAEQRAAILLQQQQKRLHAPRSLWDPMYNEDSWITQSTLPAGDKAIRLLPRLKPLIAAHYPGTKLAVTEHYYGGRKDITGAIAHADALGIFGREGVFAATLWEGGLLRKLDPADPGYDPSAYEYIDAAFDMYRNFNGSNSTS